MHIHTYIQRSAVEIQTSVHRNVICRSTTAPSPVFSPSSILPSPSPRCAFLLATKNTASLSRKVVITISIYIFFFASKNYAIMELRDFKCRKSESVCTGN